MVRNGFAFALIAVLFAATGCGETATAPIATAPAGAEIPIEVVKPDGPGPFPAVVVLHSCAGIRGGTQRDWAKRLVQMGYLAAIPDSFGPRGYPGGVCTNGTLVGPAVRAVDAYATLHFLEDRQDVIADRIGVTGYSHGGWTILAALSAPAAARYQAAAQARHGFRAAVALYPECRYFPRDFGGYRPAAPLLILAGELDDWTPASPCEELTRDSQAAGLPVSIKVYPGAFHAFDSYLPVTRVALALRGKGATIGGNAAAREDSIVQVREFFARTLSAGTDAAAPR